MYVIKHIPEDFVVNEVSSVSFASSGNFLIFGLWKRDLSLFEAVKRLSLFFHVPVGNFSYAGIKDRRGVTVQVCSVRGVSKEHLAKFSSDDLMVEFLGFRNEPVHVGELDGNSFRVVVRNIDSLPVIESRFRNLFGDQRFSKNNVEVGRCIIKRDFEGAVNLIKESHPVVLRGRDFVGTLRSLHRKLLILFVHAYQGFLWNKAALKSELSSLPIVGFGSEDLDKDTIAVLAGEGVRPSDFVVRELPEVSAEGSVRDVWVEVKDLKVSKLEVDEFFVGKKMVVLEFFLPRGCYATEFIRQNFSQ